MLSLRRQKANSKISNEEKFITDLYGKHYCFMKSTAMKVLMNETEAEEIIQDVFLFLLPRIAQIMNHEDSQIKSYLYIVTRGRSLNLRDARQKRNANEIAFPEDEEARAAILGSELSAEDDYFQKLSIENLGKLMDNIPENYRNAFYLKYEFGYNDHEIAEAMGIKQQNVRVYTNRAEKMLRKLAREEEMKHG